MVKLQSKTLRGGVVIVGSAKVQVSADGCVEVPQEAAAKLLQGADWKKVGESSDPSPSAEQPAEPAVSEEPELEDMTKDQLIAMANELGLAVDQKISKLKLTQAIRAAKRG